MVKKDLLVQKEKICIKMEKAEIDARTAVSDGFVRAVYSLSGTGRLPKSLEEVLCKWRYRSPVTEKLYNMDKNVQK